LTPLTLYQDLIVKWSQANLHMKSYYLTSYRRLTREFYLYSSVLYPVLFVSIFFYCLFSCVFVCSHLFSSVPISSIFVYSHVFLCLPGKQILSVLTCSHLFYVASFRFGSPEYKSALLAATSLGLSL
jgi:hypothetical protein